MIGQELLELLGASALLVIVLSVFWKADDAVSPEFRSDVSDWLLRLKPPNANSPVGLVVYQIFTRVFGSRHLSWRCLLASVAVSLGATLAVLVFLASINDSGRMVLQDLRLNRFKGSGWLLIVLFVNPAVDFVSLSVTRWVLFRTAKNKMRIGLAVTIDFFGSGAVLVALFWLIMRLLTAIIWSMATIMDWLFIPPSSPLAVELESAYLLVTSVLILASAFVSSAWLWAAWLSTLMIRALAKSSALLKTLQYVLPIKEKPIRAIGELAFLASLLVLLLRWAVISLINII